MATRRTHISYCHLLKFWEEARSFHFRPTNAPLSRHHFERQIQTRYASHYQGSPRRVPVAQRLWKGERRRDAGGPPPANGGALSYARGIVSQSSISSLCFTHDIKESSVYSGVDYANKLHPIPIGSPCIFAFENLVQYITR